MYLNIYLFRQLIIYLFRQLIIYLFRQLIIYLSRMIITWTCFLKQQKQKKIYWIKLLFQMLIPGDIQINILIDKGGCSTSKSLARTQCSGFSNICSITISFKRYYQHFKRYYQYFKRYYQHFKRYYQHFTKENLKFPCKKIFNIFLTYNFLFVSLKTIESSSLL